MKMHGRKLTLHVMNVARQSDSKDCSLFAMAYAEILLCGLDPTNAVFNQSYEVTFIKVLNIHLYISDIIFSNNMQSCHLICDGRPLALNFVKHDRTKLLM